MDDKSNDPLDIPAFLKRDADNRAEFMNMSEVEQANVDAAMNKASKAPPKLNGAAAPEKAPKVAKASAKAKAPVKAAAKAPVKAKGAAKTAKPAKVAAKAKAPSKAPKAAKGEEVLKDKYGLRVGSMKSRAAAMYATTEGATLVEVKDVLGSIQLNVLKDLEEEGWNVVQKKETREGQRPVTRYWLKGKKKA